MKIHGALMARGWLERVMDAVNLGGAPRKCSALLQVQRVTAPILQELGANKENHRKPSVHGLQGAMGQSGHKVLGRLGGSERWCKGQTLKTGAQLCHVLARRYWQCLTSLSLGLLTVECYIYFKCSPSVT